MTAVELDHVSYAYGNSGGRTTNGGVPAVQDVSLRVGAGEVVAMLGPNGAGKSTTLLMLLDMLPPRTGTVRLFGGAADRAVAGGRVGAMPQVGGVPPRASVGDL